MVVFSSAFLDEKPAVRAPCSLNWDKKHWKIALQFSCYMTFSIIEDADLKLKAPEPRELSFLSLNCKTRLHD